MPTVALVIITFNEAENIADCILSAKGLVQQVIVLDSGSADDTCEIAKKLGAEVHYHAFDGHIQQKNRAQNLATTDWILSLDADERIDDKLRSEIPKTLENPQFEGYYMNRLNFFGQKPIKTCGWYPDKKLRLWKKNSGTWAGQNPHDCFELFQKNNAGHIQGDILHYTYKNKKAMKLQVNKFAGIAAKFFAKKSYMYLIGKLLFSTPFKFIKTYLLGNGFRDGGIGFFICKEQTREVFLKYKLALQIKFSGNG